MPSLLPGFEYDIFISYRQKDNKGDRWVTEFVNALRTELESTFKEDVSIYFDENPHDGLLETHNVDKSVEGKLKCVIFIPIVSQTYCDPKSFAWKNELCAFNTLAKEDQFGRDIALSNGNVASRILPVKIHDLDAEDKTLLENELGGVLRAVEFIFKSQGVNRPLNSTDKREENANRTFYRDQINKVANAVKEIITGLKIFETGPSHQPKYNNSHQGQPRVRRGIRKLLSNSAVVLLILLLAGYFIYNYSGAGDKLLPQAIEKSIAVLPFTNMSKDEDQEYFSDGLTEDIITQLAKIKALKVISRTSVMQYKKNPKPIAVMAAELHVATILEGSVQRSGDQVRITAQLINAATDEHLWAESYDRPIKELFKVQSDVASQIALALRTRLTATEKSEINKAPTTNMEAYTLYQKSQYNLGDNSKESFARSIQLLLHAIQLDKNFALAYATLAGQYSYVAYYQYDLYPLSEAWRLAKESANQALSLDSTLGAAYNSFAYIERTHDWNWKQAEKDQLKAIQSNPNNYANYSILLGAMGRFEESLDQGKHDLAVDPLNAQNYVDVARMNYYAGKLDEANHLLQGAIGLEPNYRPALGLMGCILEHQGKLDSAVAMISRSATRTGTDYEGSDDRFDMKPTSYKKYWNDVLSRSLEDAKKKRIPSILMAILYMRIGNQGSALDALEKAFQDREGGIVYVNVEPLFIPLHTDPRFKKIITSMGLTDSH